MNWTREKPTKPGWYWWKLDNYARVVMVDTGEWDRERGEPRLIFTQPGMEMAYRVSEWDGEWAGPIPKPGEAKPASPCTDCDGNLCLSCAKPADHKPATCGECRWLSIYGDRCNAVAPGRSKPVTPADKACDEGRKV
jgi:hypothetical protein